MTTQNDQILNYLQAGNRLTPLGALRLFGCFRLSARIYDLRKNYDIIKETKQIGKKTVAEYYIKQEPKQLNLF